MKDNGETPDLMSGMHEESAVAKAIGYEPLSLRNVRLRGEGPPYTRVGRTIYYAEADVKAWLAKKRVQPGAVRADLTAPKRLANANGKAA